MIDIEKPMSQRAFANAIGLSRETISKAVNRGVLTPGATAQCWIAELIDHYLEVASGRGDGVLDLAAERAALAATQREKLRLEIDERRGELIPSAIALSALKDVLTAVRSVVLSWPGRVVSQLIGKTLQKKDFQLLDDLARDLLRGLSEHRYPPALIRQMRDWETKGVHQPRKAAKREKRKARSSR